MTARRTLFSLMVGGMLALISGCGGGLERGAVNGQVTVAGTPLKAGRVLFLPLPPLKGPTVSAAIVEGKYELGRRDGPVLGLHRVEVEADLPLGFALDDEAAFAQLKGSPLPPNPIPPQFNRESTLTIQIQTGDNVFDVNVPAMQN